MNRRRLLIAGVAIVVLIAGGIIGWLIFTGNSPEEATIGDAVAVVESTTSTSAAVPTTEDAGSSDTTTAAPALVGVDGTWTVDTTIGELDSQPDSAMATLIRAELGL